MMKRRRLLSLLAASAVPVRAAAAAPSPESAATIAQPATLEVGRFSAMRPGAALPEGWKPLTFRAVERHTRYTLVADGDTVVVRAEANASASGLVRALAVDPREFPLLEWRWRVERVLERSDPRRRDGDDYPARLYVTFAADPAERSLVDRALALVYGEPPPRAALNYVWDTRTPVETILPNPYTDRARMLVVESGAARVGRWIAYRRNLLDDHRRAFGAAAPRISGIAIMTDTDNTGESAVAYYGDIRLRAP